jgi:hypothetical protein
VFVGGIAALEQVRARRTGGGSYFEEERVGLQSAFAHGGLLRRGPIRGSHPRSFQDEKQALDSIYCLPILILTKVRVSDTMYTLQGYPKSLS